VGVAKGVDEVPWFIAADLSHHQRQQCIAGNIEGHAQENVGTALVKLAGELAVCDIELEQGVAGRQRHLLDVGGIPGAYQMAT